MIAPWSIEPTGWAHCDGRLLPLPEYNYLYSNIGTTYGGDGTTTVALPDTRGRAVIGDDNGGGIWPIGLNYGGNDVALGVSDISAHTHTLPDGGTTGSTGGSGDSANNYQPSLVMRYLISFLGNYPSPEFGIGFPAIGEIRIIAGASADGLNDGSWRLLDGALYLIEENDPLFELIGTTFGGDGQSTYGVPNMQAIVPAGHDNAFPFVVGQNTGRATLLIATSSLPRIRTSSHRLRQHQHRPQNQLLHLLQSRQPVRPRRLRLLPYPLDFLLHPLKSLKAALQITRCVPRPL